MGEDKMRKCTSLSILIFFAIIISVSVSAWNQCNNTITTSGKYTLNASLTCTGYSLNLDNYIFRINISNVEIDCEGYSLTANSSDGLFDTWGVRGYTTTGRSNITVRNCNLNTIGQTQIGSIQLDYDDYWSIIDNNISIGADAQFWLDIHWVSGAGTHFNITGNRFTITSMPATNSIFRTYNGMNCSPNIKLYNNNFNFVTATGYVLSNFDNCEIAPSNSTAFGNHYTDSRWNCTDNNSNGFCDNAYNIYRIAGGVYPYRDYFALTQYPYNCSALWSCNGYANCTGGANSSCNSVYDAHYCVGAPAYSGNFSEFTPQNCTYNCTPNWTCSGYGSCNSSNLSACNVTTDLNTCGSSYTGNYSEFTPQACNFTTCTPDWSCTGYGTCNQSGLQPCNAVSDLNVCGDSYSGDYSEFTPQACEPSPFTYTADDLAPASINAIAKGVLAFARLAVAFFMVGFILWGLGKLGYEKFKGWKR